MFNNPFDSFHDTVAEAKEEREQLDRLLTVSTPRERLLFVGVVLLLVVFAAWLFFGSVARSVAFDGVLVEPGEDVSATGRSVQALVWIENDRLADIRAGMPAVVEIELTDGGAESVGGTIETVSAVSLSEVPAAFEPVAPVTVHRVGIVIDEGHDLAAAVGKKSRIAIEIGTQSPAAFLRPR